MKRVSKLLSALLTVVLGVLFVIYKADVLSLCMTVLGVGLIVLGVVDLIRLKILTATVKGILGVAVLVIGWTLVDIALIVIGVVLGIYGISELLKRIFERKRRKKIWVLIIGFIEPVVCIAGAFLLLTQGGKMVSLTMMIAGVILIVDGALSAIVALSGKKRS